ncbi:aspartate aminotransferase family protein [Sediminibacterium sp.]|uniref:aspartate aminotransferase family protein n=1 Tax=Sediminibacterium sp. TaxID=1917865 RepID=UPI002732F1AC|nr:aminotransferase class III-fold pyridoxal phosphate-dependent enzyme [Sediminibacterium sp.]MDP3567375.1 aminotransferase class III-fold pyridoxal phosphate-dependent enzyme [Sediminibacterium sp.]
MNLFDVYPLFDITPVKAEGTFIWDDKGTKYLDFYGGHAVISIGHSHPHYVKKLDEQISQIAFYSNAVKMPLQNLLAEQLGKLSGYTDYNLFLCNSGTEANENAFKLASFHNGRKKVIAFKDSFHGRTSLSLGATDDAKLSANINKDHHVVFLPFNDVDAFKNAIDEATCAVIIEGIQGVGGINVPSPDFLRMLETECNKLGVVLILDEIQSGYGRSGKFFAHQHSAIQPHIITTAKGMGNGFPVAGVLIHPDIKAKHGMLGTTFGGNYLACAASLSVLEVIENENLISNAKETGNFIMTELKKMEGVKSVRGLGLMIGIETEGDANLIRKKLLQDEKIFTGFSSGKNTIRLLPPLNITIEEAQMFLNSINTILQQQLIPNT